MAKKYDKLNKAKPEDQQEFVIRKENGRPLVSTLASLQARKVQLQAELSEVDADITAVQAL